MLFAFKAFKSGLNDGWMGPRLAKLSIHTEFFLPVGWFRNFYHAIIFCDIFALQK
jgi:hypothetical protein